MEANRNQVYLGESVLLTVMVNGQDDPPDPDLSMLRDCRVTLLGRQPSREFSLSIINGKIQRQAFLGCKFQYELRPLREGTLQAGPVRLNLDSGTLSAPGPTIRVTGIEKQDRVLVSLAASRDTVLVDEPFDIDLSVAVRQLPAPYTDEHPMNPNAPPRITAGFLDPNPIEGLDGPDMRDTLRQLLVRDRNDAGFAINRYEGPRDPLSGGLFDFDIDSFMKPQAARFRFPREPWEKDGVRYWKYTLRLTYKPKKEGDYTFGPVEFKGDTIVGVNDSGRGITSGVFAIGPSVIVRVLPPPLAGRPASYIGAIGRTLTARAELDTQTCRVGDPLTLTLSIGGDFSLDNIRPPRLSAQEDLVRRFRIYEDTVQGRTEGKTRRYTYTLRPTQSGTFELPPIAVAYYDTDARAYHTVLTEPLPLQVKEGTLVADDIVISTSTNGAGQAGQSAGGLPAAPFLPDAAGAMPAALTGGFRHALVLATAPALFFLVVLLQAAWHRRASQRSRKRKRNALAKAEAALGTIRAARTPPADSSRIILDAVRGFLADRLDRDGAGLTPADMRRVLEQAGAAPTRAAELTAILQRHFDATFASGSGPGHDPAADARAVRALLAALTRDMEAA